MFSSAATICAPSVVLLQDEHEDGDRVPHDRAGDQRDVRGLALAVRLDRNFGKYPARDSEYVFRP